MLMFISQVDNISAIFNRVTKVLTKMNGYTYAYCQ